MKMFIVLCFTSVFGIASIAAAAQDSGGGSGGGSKSSCQSCDCDEPLWFGRTTCACSSATAFGRDPCSFGTDWKNDQYCKTSGKFCFGDIFQPGSVGTFTPM